MSRHIGLGIGILLIAITLFAFGIYLQEIAAILPATFQRYVASNFLLVLLVGNITEATLIAMRSTFVIYGSGMVMIGLGLMMLGVWLIYSKN